MTLLNRTPRPWAWFALIAALGLFTMLGTWQVSRGQAKADWRAQLETRPPPLVLDRHTPPPPAGQLRWARAAGRYDLDRQLLTEGRAHDGRPGHDVWTPLQLVAGGTVMINRGWIPIVADRSLPAAPWAPGGAQIVEGWWRALPRPGWSVADDVCEPAASWPVIVVYPDVARLTCLFGAPVQPGLLLLAPEVDGGFVREWAASGLPPERHYGYALQWFSLALASIALFMVLHRRASA